MSNLRKSVKVTNNRQLGFEDDKDLRSWIEGEQAKGRLALEVWATFNIARKSARPRDWKHEGCRLACMP